MADKLGIKFRCTAADIVYSDVAAHSEWFPTYEEAVEYGGMIVEAGNWRSFTVEKRFFKAEPERG